MTLPRPTGVEILANTLLGRDEHSPSLPPAPGIGVEAALERAVLPALQRSPSMVSFSGGRDSSAILAVAARAARRHGLPDPIAAIMRFPNAPETDETRWQELVLSHLGVEAAVVELGEELDALGPAAIRVLSRLGVHWPGNAYIHMPVLELARGGALMTGVGGDEMFGTSAPRHVHLLRGQVRPGLRDVRAVAKALLPRPLRAAIWRRMRAPHLPWLTPRGDELVTKALARDAVALPHRWDRSVRYWYRGRAYRALSTVLQAVAPSTGIAVVNPFLEPVVLAELARAGGATGFPSRTAAMRRFFGELLPPEVQARASKARFSGPVWGPAVRAFAADWDGEGIDARYVEVERLRREWLSDEPHFGSVLLLHSAWLHRHGQASASSS